MQTKHLLLTVAALAILASPVAAQPAGDAAATPPPSPAAAAPPAAAPIAIPDASLTPGADILATLKANSQFSILVKALDASGLASILQRPGPFTLAAPTDAAFQALPPAQLADLMKPENAAQLQALLTYHLINAAVPPAKIEGGKGGVQTVAGREVQIDASVSPAKFDAADVEGQLHVPNGYIYVVDKVLGASPLAAGTPAPGAAAPAG